MLVWVLGAPLLLVLVLVLVLGAPLLLLVLVLVPVLMLAVRPQLLRLLLVLPLLPLAVGSVVMPLPPRVVGPAPLLLQLLLLLLLLLPLLLVALLALVDVEDGVQVPAFEALLLGEKRREGGGWMMDELDCNGVMLQPRRHVIKRHHTHIYAHKNTALHAYPELHLLDGRHRGAHVLEFHERVGPPVLLLGRHDAHWYVYGGVRY